MLLLLWLCFSRFSFPHTIIIKKIHDRSDMPQNENVREIAFNGIKKQLISQQIPKYDNLLQEIDIIRCHYMIISSFGSLFVGLNVILLHGISILLFSFSLENWNYFALIYVNKYQLIANVLSIRIIVFIYESDQGTIEKKERKMENHGRHIDANLRTNIYFNIKITHFLCINKKVVTCSINASEILVTESD